MMLFQNPFVWLKRVRKRKGYGVHSPFAFDFVTNVLYNRDMYYAYGQMDCGLKWWQKGRVRSVRHLMFRLANYRHPKTMYCLCRDNVLSEACRYGVRGVEMQCVDDGPADMVLVDSGDANALRCIGEGTMLVLANLRENMDYWRKVKADGRITVTFDLYDIGVAFARSDLNKQDYIINW